MSWNGFGPEGGAALADAIATNEALIELDISGNRLDIQSALLIAKAISTNEQLQILRVDNMFITVLENNLEICLTDSINWTRGYV